jgi:hypothetical protein
MQNEHKKEHASFLRLVKGANGYLSILLSLVCSFSHVRLIMMMMMNGRYQYTRFPLSICSVLAYMCVCVLFCYRVLFGDTG